MSAILKIGGQKAAGGERPRAAEARFCRAPPPAARFPRARLSALLTLLGLTAVFVTAALWRPEDDPRLVLCPFRALTHYPCPGCGMTRAFCALFHFEFWRAIKFNALSPLLLVAALIAWTRAAATLFRIEWLRSFLAGWPRPSPAAGMLLLALVLVWWVARLAGGF